MTVWKSRLKGMVAGFALVIVGCLRLSAGVQVVTHWTGQPMFSFGLIEGGLVLILASLLPDSLVARIAASSKRKL